MNTFVHSPYSLTAPPRGRIHELKIWPDSFQKVEDGIKPFDVRENTSDFQVGDALVLREYEPATGQYSGRTTDRWVSYLLPGGAFGVESGWCVLGLAEHAPLPPGITDTRLW